MLSVLPLTRSLRSRFALVRCYRVQHNLIGQLRRVLLIALAPVVTDSVGEDAAVLVERSRRDGAAHLGVSLETVLCILVPEVERAIAASGAEGAVLGVPADSIDAVDVALVCRARRGLAVALEREVHARDRRQL
jgi:hypothetical protein